jgi:hypothetical protein
VRCARETRTHLVAVLGCGAIDDPDAPVFSAFDVTLSRGDGCFDAMRIEVGTAL